MRLRRRMEDALQLSSLVPLWIVWLGALPLSRAQEAFRRGDCDCNWEVEITDAVFAIKYLFLSGEPPKCMDAADADDSGEIDITDPIYLVSYLFLSGPEPPAPGPFRSGVDPTADLLSCSGQDCPFEYFLAGLQVDLGLKMWDGPPLCAAALRGEPSYLVTGKIQGDVTGDLMEWDDTFWEIRRKEGPIPNVPVKHGFEADGSGKIEDSLERVTAAWRTPGYHLLGLNLDIEDAATVEMARGFAVCLRRPSGIKPEALKGEYWWAEHQIRFRVEGEDRKVLVKTGEGVLEFDGIDTITGETADEWVAGFLPCLDRCPEMTFERMVRDGSRFTISFEGELEIRGPARWIQRCWMSGDGELIAGVESDDFDQGAYDKDFRRGIVLGLKRGSGMDAVAMTGAYGFIGLRSRMQTLFDAGILLQGSFSGELIFDGKGNLAGKIETNELYPIECFGARRQEVREESFEGGTYTVSGSGEVLIELPSGAYYQGFASAGGGILVLFSKEHGPWSCDFGRGLMIGIRVQR